MGQQHHNALSLEEDDYGQKKAAYATLFNQTLTLDDDWEGN